MACPAVEIAGKKIFLLSGYQRLPLGETNKSRSVQIQAVEKLKESPSDNPDAVAFGYLAGKWVPAA